MKERKKILRKLYQIGRQTDGQDSGADRQMYSYIIYSSKSFYAKLTEKHLKQCIAGGVVAVVVVVSMIKESQSSQ